MAHHTPRPQPGQLSPLAGAIASALAFLLAAGAHAQVVGGAGRDDLDGGNGNDLLGGGNGADVFEFDRNDIGRDQITDWSNGRDRIDVSDFDFSLEEVLATGTQIGRDVSFAFDASTSVLVHNATLVAFGANDFIVS